MFYTIHSMKTALRANKPADTDIDNLFNSYEPYWVD